MSKLFDRFNKKVDSVNDYDHNNDKGSQQVQVQFRGRMKMYDDVFHRVIISLERLEIFLELQRNIGDGELTITAVKTQRDLHENTNPKYEDLISEVQLQCSALLFQTQFDDKEVFNKSVKYFLNDLLEWYGGRNETIPYNVVESFFLPIMVSLSRQIQSVSEILEVVKDYVVEIKRMDDYSEEEKAEAIKSGWEAWIKAQNIVNEEMKSFRISNIDVSFTEHKRGESINGYKRLYLAFLELYDVTTPAKLLFRTVNTFLPELSELCPDINEDQIEALIKIKKDKEKDIIQNNIKEEEKDNKVEIPDKE